MAIEKIDIKGTFGYKLYTERNKAGISPQQLADEMNSHIQAEYDSMPEKYSGKNIRDWEVNKNLPGIDEVNLIVEAISKVSTRKISDNTKLRLANDLK